MIWHPHTEQPVGVLATALIAIYDEEARAPYLLGIFMWERGRWVDEITGEPLAHEVFCWQDEDDLCATVPPFNPSKEWETWIKAGAP